MYWKRWKHKLFRAAVVGVALVGLAGQTQAQEEAEVVDESPRYIHLARPDCRSGTPMPAVPGGMTSDPTSFDPSLQPVTSAALSDNLVSFGPGYLDNAVPFSHVRLRYDSAQGSNRPDRAEFFYAKCGCFVGDGQGPPLPETSVDYQDINAYLEYAPNNWFSVFVELPYRFLNPDNNANTHGIGDMNFGAKVALLADEERIVTFQVRGYVPTGDSGRGLGTNHYSIEPSLLYAQNLTDQLQLFAQVGDWISIDGNDFAGNVLRYGVGASYTLIDNCDFKLAPVLEVLGWTVLDGQEYAFPENLILDSSGTTIVNGKAGVRMTFGRDGRSDLYVGYGRALTGAVWYEDIFRVEYRLRF